MNPENTVSHWAKKERIMKGSKWLKGTVVTTNVSEARNSPLKVSYAARECRKGNAYDSLI